MGRNCENKQTTKMELVDEPVDLEKAIRLIAPSTKNRGIRGNGLKQSLLSQVEIPENGFNGRESFFPSSMCM